MKKQYPTVIDSSAQELPFLYVSGGKIGMQLKLSPQDLRRAANAETADVTV